MRQLGYLLPAALLAAVVFFGRPSWWAVAMLAGGCKFAWDWLWGERRVLLASYGLRQAAVGVVLLLAGIVLARGLGMSLTEFHETAKGLRRSAALLYHLPAIGIGFLLYGLLIWSRAWASERE